MSGEGSKVVAIVRELACFLRVKDPSLIETFHGLREVLVGEKSVEGVVFGSDGRGLHLEGFWSTFTTHLLRNWKSDLGGVREKERERKRKREKLVKVDAYPAKIQYRDSPLPL